MESLLQDLRHAVKRLLGDRGLTLVAVLTLGLGIGANTALFSLVKAVMLQPLPYGNPERLVMVWEETAPGETTWLSVQEVLSYRADAPSLAQMAAYRETSVNLTGGQEPERVRAAATTVNLFETLGVPARLGRSFVAADGEPGGSEVILLGHGLWQRRFGGVPDVIGRTIQVNGRARTVVGVMPPTFRLPFDYRAERPTEAWVPLPIDPSSLGAWGDRSLIGVGRLKADVPAATATSEFKVLRDRWIRAGHVADQGEGTFVRSAIPLRDFVTGNVRGPLGILLGAVAFVLLIACANVVNLFLARADARGREIAVRAALGAGRGRLARQLLAESLMLSALGGLAGLALGGAALQILTTLRPPSVPRVEEVGLDGGVLAFTAGVSVLTGLLFGLVPALRLTRLDFAGALNDGGWRGSPGRSGQALRHGLVIGQVAFSVVLVVGAGLLVRSLVALHRVELGFDPRNVLTAQLQLPEADYPEPAQVTAFYRELAERLGELPGVQAAGAVRILPLSDTIGDWSLGKRFHMGGGGDLPWLTIVGVVRTVRHNAVVEPPRAEMYLAHQQLPRAIGGAPRAMTLVLRTAPDPLTLVGALREAVRRLAPSLPLANVRTMEQVTAAALSSSRFTAVLLGAFAALALVLAAVGIYGTVSLLVTERANEIGIRMALGAGRRAILGLVLGRGMVLAGAGIAMGVGGALFLTRLLENLVYGVGTLDPITFATVPALLGAVALLACLHPARRAAALDPVVTLRRG